MKCISCGNLISDSATVCPYCNKKYNFSEKDLIEILSEI